MKKKPEAKSTGSLKDEDFVPWNGITLNRCLAVAAIAALLSVGFQILQEAVDIDDLEEAENEVWTPPESSDHPSEPWFFKGWFGSSTSASAIVEEPEATDTAEQDVSVVEEVEEAMEPEESELPAIDEETETEKESIMQEPVELEKREESKEKPKPAEQWGLKSKGKYMEAKGNKIRTATEEGPRKEVFPFNLAKKPKDSPKEKSYKEGKYQKKYEEKKHDYPKKQEYEKSFKKESKYLKQDKGKKEDTDYKGHKEYHYEKDYKKKYDPRHHG